MGVPRRGSAFSLIELMIVLAVLAILAAMAVPMLRGSPMTQLRAAADLLVADLGYTQIESIAHGDDPRILSVAADGRSYWIAAQSTAQTPLVNPADRQPHRVTFGAGRAAALAGVTLRVLVPAAGNPPVVFRMYGQLAPNSATSLRLSLGANSITVSLDPVTGQASVGTVQ